MRRATRSSKRIQAAASTLGLLAIGLIVFFATLLYRDVYWGVPPAIPVSTMTARCDGDGRSNRSPCVTTVVRLNPGRFRVTASIPGSLIMVRVDDASAIERSHVLLVRTTVPGRLTMVRTAAEGETIVADATVQNAGARSLVAIPARAGAWDLVRFRPASEDQPTAIEELGFFGDREGLLRPAHQPWPEVPMQRFFLRFVPIATLISCALLVAAAWFLPERSLRTKSPWLITILCLAICTLELGTTFSPYWSQDLRSYYATDWNGPGGNLLGGLQEGARIVQGLGETIADGFVQWHRMPGYGLFCAAAAALSRTTDLVEIAALVIVLQILFYSVALGLFVAAAQRLFSPWVAWTLGVLLALLPKQLAYTQADSIIAPIQLLVLAALIRYIAAETDERHAPFRQFLDVNLAFALWFFMRSDVLPGWIIIACLLARRQWQRLAVAVALMLLIAVPWGVYKRSYRHEFTLMPTNTGEALLLGLCEVPGAFAYECADEGYFTWARRTGHADPAASSASRHAIAEVVRHWATYPVHFAFMVLAKAHRAATVESFPGFQTRFNLPFAGRRATAGSTHAFYALITILAAAFVANYQRRRTVLLGWALLLNMPLFFVMFASSGRFYAAAGISLIVTTVPLLCDRRFYSAIAGRPWRVAAAVACVFAFAIGAGTIERLVVEHDAFHYWAPLLDPAKSTLRFVGH